MQSVDPCRCNCKCTYNYPSFRSWFLRPLSLTWCHRHKTCHWPKMKCSRMHHWCRIARTNTSGQFFSTSPHSNRSTKILYRTRTAASGRFDSARWQLCRETWPCSSCQCSNWMICFRSNRWDRILSNLRRRPWLTKETHGFLS